MTSLLLCFILVLYLCCRYFRIYFYIWYSGFPWPKYRVILDRDEMITMQDGIKLATDIYRPKSEGKFPVIIARTPYSKTSKDHHYKEMAEIFVSQGYVFIIQDVRGKHGSEGEFTPYINEGLDGLDTINWAGSATWSNGKLALFGFSYLGSCAWLAAQYKSPYLKTILPMFTTQDAYAIWMDKGIPYFKAPLYWLSKYLKKTDDEEITHKKIFSVLWKLPVHEIDVQLSHRKITQYREILAHIKPDLFWKKRSLGNTVMSDLNIPALIVGGWYDSFLNGTVADYKKMIDSPADSKNQQSVLKIGPWSHNPTQKFPGIDFGPSATFFSILLDTLKWCDIYLKEQIPTKKPAKINFFVMGRNEWRETSEWPLPQCVEENFFLSVLEKKKNRAENILSKVLSKQENSVSYLYNPNDPTPFRGSILLREDGWVGPVEQTELLERKDMICFASAPFDRELIIVGTPKAILFVSSNSLDTDFCVKISDIHPNGKIYNISAGFLRMRFRESLEEVKLMKPGVIYRIEINLHPVANAFLKGHAIQFQISSSDFPVHVRNLNTGLSCEFTDEILETEQRIYFGGPYDSQIILPTLVKGSSDSDE